MWPNRQSRPHPASPIKSARLPAFCGNSPLTPKQGYGLRLLHGYAHPNHFLDVRKSISTMGSLSTGRYGAHGEFLVSSALFANQVVPHQDLIPAMHQPCELSIRWSVCRLVVVGVSSSSCIRQSCTCRSGATVNAAWLRRCRPDSQRKDGRARNLVDYSWCVRHQWPTILRLFTLNPRKQGGQGKLFRKASCCSSRCTATPSQTERRVRRIQETHQGLRP